jgi:regulator of cell morphogenesis and NO signaling
MMTESMKTKTIGSIVTDDFRAASIFKEAGIDFCCGGNKSLETACGEKQIEVDELAAKINALAGSGISQQHDYKNWDLSFLADYIVNTHHQFVKKNLPELLFYTRKIADVHGANHPELLELADLFFEINRELTQHLKQEEDVLFPAIKTVLNSNNPGAKSTIKIEINRMHDEHEFAGGAMDRINEITNGYQVPSDVCNTYEVCFKLLEAFEDDLHIHVHLENNILFPKALELAK